MGNTVKILEQLGQNASIKQFDSLNEMLENANLNQTEASNLRNSENELTCLLFPPEEQ